ncbi:hypothetical protein CBR_g19353 [Chara braunii]|uniref:Uncharacterized protein n=1 Tax=Chara braunii TaxID=69332 RepID=A0A388KXS4_CHABU|nr:hypothetical protein CBR_g19353 [Chara braunii]|eukprot:GBG74841.1 hypothetical protein CBR_g19353 [Chara braunii]
MQFSIIVQLQFGRSCGTPLKKPDKDFRKIFWGARPGFMMPMEGHKLKHQKSGGWLRAALADMDEQSWSGTRRMARLDGDDGGAPECSRVMTTKARQGEDNDGADDHATTAGKQQAGAGG